MLRLRTLGLVLLAICTLGAASVEDDRTKPLIDLLNSRAAQSPRAFAAAAKAVREEAERGSVLHQFVLAVLEETPDAPKEMRLDSKTRKRFLENSREQIENLAKRKDNALAWYLLSLEHGDVAMLERAAEGGNVQAQNAYGTYLVTSAFEAPSNAGTTNAVPRQLERAVGFFKAAAGKKDSNGIYNLGMCYLHGYVGKPDPERAIYCFSAAAEAGHPEAINNLGGIYRDGVLVQTNAAMAVKWFRKSAELGNTYGMLNFALALSRGDGIARNEASAAKILKVAADRGNIEAMNVYGMCLWRGQGVKKNAEEAFKWFRRSAEAGFPPAMDNLSVCYGRGEGVVKDVLKSALWKMRHRAACGDPEAQRWLMNEGKGFKEESR